MSNMKQNAGKSESQAIPPVKSTTVKKPTAKKAKADVKKEIKVTLPNGVGKGKKKRKADEVPVVVKAKKHKSVDDDNILHSSDEETDTLTGRRNVEPEVKAKGKKKKLVLPKVTKSKAGSKIAVKRQKGLLEVPKLATISGVLFVIGENDVGQLGFEENIQVRKRPAEHSFPGCFVNIAAGAMHSVCVTNKGEVYTFGCNDEGALGRPTDDEEHSEYKPGKVDIPDVVVKVTAGDSHSAALTENGRVYIWGNFRNAEGPMGLMAQGVKSMTPVRLLHNVTIVDIASGSEHFVCLSNEGAAYSCGCGEIGQLGRISERSSKGNGRKGLVELLQPKIIPLRHSGRVVPISDIWTGSYSTFLKSKSTGAIYAFGLNNYYQLGLPLAVGDHGGFEEGRVQFKPEKTESFSTDLGWQQISGGQHHTLCLDNNGHVYSLGRKEYGRLGLGEDCDETSIPTLIPSLANTKCVNISSGNVASFSISADGSVYSWGFGTTHQLGHGNDEDCYVPKLIEGNFLNSWHAFRVSGGGQHTLILANRKGTTEEREKK